MLRHWPVMVLSSVVVAVVDAALAAGADDSSRNDLDVTLSAGAGVGPDYEGSDDYEPAPLLSLQIGNLYHPNTHIGVRGLSFQSNFLPHDRFELGIVADYLSDYDNVEDDAVEELERPSKAVHVGLLAGFEFEDERHIQYGVELEATYDVLHGNGAVITPQASIRVPVARNAFLNGSLAASWASREYMSNRFGISAADAARSGLRPFDADAGFKDVELGLGATYAFSKNWSVTMSGLYQHMLGDAADSPIVDDRGSRDAFRFGALVNYRF
jgi:outer membrane scaffolding protein for murein synthesis (MipA/OmpV family)